MRDFDRIGELNLVRNARDEEGVAKAWKAHGKLYERDADWLREKLERYDGDAMPIVVLTHHAPTKLKSSAPGYEERGEGKFGTRATAFAEANLTPAVRAWAFGHTHWNCDYVHERFRQARFVTNQLGSPWETSDVPAVDANGVAFTAKRLPYSKEKVIAIALE